LLGAMAFVEGQVALDGVVPALPKLMEQRAPASSDAFGFEGGRDDREVSIDQRLLGQTPAPPRRQPPVPVRGESDEDKGPKALQFAALQALRDLPRRVGIDQCGQQQATAGVPIRGLRAVVGRPAVSVENTETHTKLVNSDPTAPEVSIQRGNEAPRCRGANGGRNRRLTRSPFVAVEEHLITVGLAEPSQGAHRIRSCRGWR